MGIKENIHLIRNNIDAAAKVANVNPNSITIVAATKKRAADEIEQAISSGITIIGENIVQEAEAKLGKLSCEKHFIGHLQTNKAKRAVALFDCIQSVDSLKLATEINKKAFEAGKHMRVMIEVNTAKEESKFGISLEDVEEFYHQLLKLTNIKVIGIMSVLPDIKAENTRPYFRQLKAVQQKLGIKYLSAGMSNDYLVAIEEGANMLRLGTAIFGPRK